MSPLSLAILLLTSVATLGAEDAAKPAWKPMLDSSATFHRVNKHRADLGQGAKTMQVEWDSKLTISSVENGRATLAFDNSEPLVTVDGRPQPAMQIQVSDSADLYALSGEKLQEDGVAISGPGVDSSLFGGFRFPPIELEIGSPTKVHYPGLDKQLRSPFTVVYTYRGKERVLEWEAIKIEFEYTEDAGPDPVKAKGTIWLSPADGSLVRLLQTVTNVDFGGGLETVEQEIVRTGR